MPNFICITCGTQHAESEQPPDRCATCEDERQYVGLSGQQWTTIEALAETHEIALGADGVVVGSALVEKLCAGLDRDGKATASTVETVAELVASLADGVRAARRVAAK